MQIILAVTLPFLHQTPEKAEPVLADKEVIMAALNIKTMNFGAVTVPEAEAPEENLSEGHPPNGVPILLDLAFACNVRYLDDHEMYLRSGLKCEI
jgi:hypothetical protein